MNDTAKTIAGLVVLGIALYTIRRMLSGDPVNIPVQGNRTLTEDQLSTMVTTFYGLAWIQGGPLFEDEQSMARVILLCNTNADLAAFANKYGKRAPWWGTDMDIFTTVNALFSTSEVQALNTALRAKGITIQF